MFNYHAAGSADGAVKTNRVDGHRLRFNKSAPDGVRNCVVRKGIITQRLGILSMNRKKARATNPARGVAPAERGSQGVFSPEVPNRPPGWRERFRLRGDACRG